MGQEFVVPSFNTNRYYNRNTDSIMTLPTGATTGSILFVGSDGTVDQDNNNLFWDDTNNIFSIGDNTPAASATGGSLQVTHNNAAGSEVLSSWRLGLDTGTSDIRIESGSGTSTIFIPTVRGISGAANSGLTLVGQTTTDSGTTTACLELRGRIGTATVPTTKPLMFIRAASTIVTRLNPNAKWSVEPIASTSGVVADWVLIPAANTGITASTESNIFRVDAATRTWATTGTVATQRDVMFNGMTYASASASQTFTIASTLFASTPIAGNNAIITNSYAAWFQANAITSTAETIALFTVSDDTTGLLSIENNTNGDTNFTGRIRGVSTSTISALVLMGQGTTDSGTSGHVRVNARIGASTAVAARPLFTVENNGTEKIISWGTTNNRTSFGDFNSTPTVYGASGRVMEINRSGAAGGMTMIAWATNDAQSPVIDFAKATSATVGTMTGAVAVNEALGYLNFQGTDGTNFLTSARISSYADGTWGTNDSPGRIEFATATDGGTTLSERMRINNAGVVIINSGAASGTYTSNTRVGQLFELNTSANYGGGQYSCWSATDAQASILDFNKAGSNTIGTFTVVAADETLGFISFRGSDGTNFEDAAYIKGSVDGTPGNDDMPGRIEIFTTPDGSKTAVEAVRVSSRRNLIVNRDSIAEPSTSVGTLVLTNSATAPTTSVDVCSLYAADVAGAGTASLALFTEQAVVTESVTSDRTLLVTINGTAYKICLKV